MEIFNIGPLELVFILLIMLIVLGPEDMIKTGRSIAKGISKLIRSPIWKSLISTSQEIRELPRKFIREAGLEESAEELKKLKDLPKDVLTIKPPSGPAVDLKGKKTASEPKADEKAEDTAESDEPESGETTVEATEAKPQPKAQAAGSPYPPKKEPQDAVSEVAVSEEISADEEPPAPDSSDEEDAS